MEAASRIMEYLALKHKLLQKQHEMIRHYNDHLFELKCKIDQLKKRQSEQDEQARPVRRACSDTESIPTFSTVWGW